MDAYIRLCRAGPDGTPVAGLRYRYNDREIHGEIRPLIGDLDSLPFLDYERTDHSLLVRGRIRALTQKDLQRNFGFSITRMMTFGCPYTCAYCINNRYHKLYPHYGHLRRYSISHFIDETRYQLERLPFVRYIMIDDDAFMSLSVEVLKDFCEKYKKMIGLPFAVGGIRPEAVTDEKVSLLIDTGLISVRMGIQSGSERTNREIYKRHFSKEMVLSAARHFAAFKKRLRPPFYDVIVDNPWEREEDRRATLGLFQDLPRPYYVSAFSLTLFPGTDLFSKALGDGIVSGYDPEKKFAGLKKSAYNLAIMFSGFFRYPRWLFRMLSGPKAINSTREYPILYLLYSSMNLAFRLISYYTNPVFLRTFIRKRNRG